ncbi:hypothetical protein [Methanosarcina sp. KYL-1]|uniref:hypothetical protein n=1 Tax=Methanosarcina sp. KYL-1 TaxID=2602068 RepID=UPI00210159C9|nr:hypothetical protein [Methanosarcina sp. KYL-1]
MWTSTCTPDDPEKHRRTYPENRATGLEKGIRRCPGNLKNKINFFVEMERRKT